MIDLSNAKTLNRCTREYRAGETLFLEGDDTLDMFVLVRGRLEVYKDNQLIAEVTEPGSLVGEMSYLLGSVRTATVKAVADSQVIPIASGRIADCLRDVPEFAPQIAQSLARRLQETTQVVHGLKEFCDQLPDAVIMTDRDLHVLAWNRAAEKLHGLSWQQIKGGQLEDVYMDPEEYHRFIGDVLAGRALHEKKLWIKHPDEGQRYVSTSTTVLYDGHHNVDGFLFLSRDVTQVRKLEEKYRLIRNWLLPIMAVLALAVGGLTISVPRFSKGIQVLDRQQESFRARIQQDSQRLSSSLAEPLAAGDTTAVTELFRRYFVEQAPEFHCIKGLIVLDGDKKVIAAHGPAGPENVAVQSGVSYSGITFQGDERSVCRLLSLFRPDKEHPMGAPGLELACGMGNAKNGAQSWLVFQLDPERLSREFGIDQEVLARMRF
ncbi:MAG: hypothetical protein A2521_05915 [Deltaproteobacteria bacterium RIFOXYD12_FULL_57_12]|nr:MAG: hypothetical protein A2521_05915 [Deltaproteobacteria bacterium RIFOXYD12_FULL_57_12]